MGSAVDRMELGAWKGRAHGIASGKRDGAIGFSPENEHRDLALRERGEARRGTLEHVTAYRLEHTSPKPLVLHLHLVSLYPVGVDRKSTRLNSSHSQISYAVFCLKK